MTNQYYVTAEDIAERMLGIHEYEDLDSFENELDYLDKRYTEVDDDQRRTGDRAIDTA